MRLIDRFLRMLACDPQDYPADPSPAPVAGEEQVWAMRQIDGGQRKGDWMETVSGRRFYPLDPWPEDVCVFDIAHHLGRIDRYNGAIRTEHYSVAEHAVLMAEALLPVHGPLVAYQALHHDDPEAYIGDMIRPLKRNVPAFGEAEAVVWSVVVEHFLFLRMQGEELHPAVKEADNRILVDERAQVINPSSNTWGIDHLEPLGIKIEAMRPRVATARYLETEDMLAKLIVRDIMA